MGQRTGTLEQRPSQHECPLPTERRHGLIRDGLVAPDEHAPFLYHPSEEILIFAAEELGPKRRYVIFKNRLLQEHVASPSFAPVDDESRWVRCTIVETALDNPRRRAFVKARFHRPED